MVRYRAILWVCGCRHVLGLDIGLYCGSILWILWILWLDIELYCGSVLQTCIMVRYRAILWVGGCRHVLWLDIEL